MKVAKLQYGDRTASAVIDGETARIVSEWSTGPVTSIPFDAPCLAVSDLKHRAEEAKQSLSLGDVRLVPPSGPLTKLICLGLNYKNHVDETHNDLPPNPTLFTKFPDALVGHRESLLCPRISETFDFEGEIAVVIGKPGRHIHPDDALEHVFGYTIMMDGSVREYQKHSPSAGKNFWRSGSLGPWIVTADEISDPRSLRLETRLNDQTVQSTTADMMLYDIPSVISYISRWTPLSSGDVIATGTPGGVGARRKPPLWMRADDTIEVEVSSIGVLSNRVELEA